MKVLSLCVLILSILVYMVSCECVPRDDIYVLPKDSRSLIAFGDIACHTTCTCDDTACYKFGDHINTTKTSTHQFQMFYEHQLCTCRCSQGQGTFQCGETQPVEMYRVQYLCPTPNGQQHTTTPTPITEKRSASTIQPKNGIMVSSSPCVAQWYWHKRWTEDVGRPECMALDEGEECDCFNETANCPVLPHDMNQTDTCLQHMRFTALDTHPTYTCKVKYCNCLCLDKGKQKGVWACQLPVKQILGKLICPKKPKTKPSESLHLSCHRRFFGKFCN